MSIHIGLSDTQRAGAVKLLSDLLADEYVLYTKTRNYHWNVTGPHFNDLHKFFEAQYTAVDAAIDEIAEYIRSLGERSPGTLTEFLAAARIKEGIAGDASSMVRDLLASHESIVRQLRHDLETAQEQFHAADVADFLTGLLEDHQKQAWMLRSIAA
jgi:starvation-inducible DNA-binding protein